MGRAKYSPEARNAIMAAFVTATKAIIDEEGIDAASIRRVSTSAGYSSATLYLYFEDMNELITMSLISYLSDYVRDVISTTPPDESVEETYRRTWRLFCEHAFSHPQSFLNLYFGPQSGHVNEIVRKYYELFPEELKNASPEMLKMLERGTLSERNHAVIEKLGAEKGLSEHEINLVNELTVAYFHSFLQRAAIKPFMDDEFDAQVDRFLEGAFFVLHSK